MGFLNPYNLLFLPLALLPVIIHLIKHKKVKEEPFSDIRLVERARIDIRRRVLLKELIKLLMRILVIVSLVLTLSGLYIGEKGIVKLLIIIDNSPSMGFIKENETLFGRAKQAVSELIKNVPSNIKISVRGLCGNVGCNYIYDRAILNNIVKSMPWGFSSPDLKFTLSDLQKDDDKNTRLLFFTDGFDNTSINELDKINRNIDVFLIASEEDLGYISVENRIILNDRPYIYLTMSNLESRSEVSIEICEEEERRTEIIEVKDGNSEIWVRTNFGSGYIHLINLWNTFSSYVFFGQMTQLNIYIDSVNDYYNKIINASIIALRSVFPITVDNSRKPDLSIIISDDDKSTTASGNTLQFIVSGSKINKISDNKIVLRECYYGRWAMVSPVQWRWKLQNISLDLSDIRFRKLVLSDEIFDRDILVSDDGKSILSVKNKGEEKVYFCSIPLSSEFSNLIMSGGILKIMVVVINDIIKLSEYETDYCKEKLTLVYSPFSQIPHTGLIPGLYKTRDNKVIGVNIKKDEFSKIDIDVIKNQLKNDKIYFYYDLSSYINSLKGFYYDLRPLLLIFIFIILILDSIIFYPAFRHLVVGAVLKMSLLLF
ncbi:MAG: vWA domain-containing protein [bacterium]